MAARPSLTRLTNTNRWKRISYTAAALVYDHIAGALNGKRRRSLALARLQPGERVLLLGAGTGLDLECLPPGPPPLLAAIDLTPAMLARLRRRAARLGLPVDARIMDGQALEFPDASFDVVVLHFIVAVIPDPACCLRETARVLRPGGRAVILDKFIPDGTRPPLFLRLLNPLASLLATEVTRQLGPLLAGSGLRVEHAGPAGFGGLLRNVLCLKD